MYRCIYIYIYMYMYAVNVYVHTGNNLSGFASHFARQIKLLVSHLGLCVAKKLRYKKFKRAGRGKRGVGAGG